MKRMMLVAMTSQQQQQPVPPPQSQSRQAAEEARKDRTLAEFLLMLDEYEPLVRLFLILVFVNPGVFLRSQTK